MHYLEQVDGYFEKLINTLQKIDKLTIIEVIKLIESTVKNNHTIYVMGNGGSASTASHMTNDLGNIVTQICGERIKIYCLSDNIPTITAIANDYSYDLIYLRQLQGALEKEDLVIIISGSGNSQNILNVAEYARLIGAKIVALTGFNGGKLGGIADFNLNAPINNMQISEDIHLIFNHLITYILSEARSND